MTSSSSSPYSDDYYQTAPAVPVSSLVHHQEHLFHVYAHQRFDDNEYTIGMPPKHVASFFGATTAYDWDIRDGPDANAKVVGRMRGLGVPARKSTDEWYCSSQMVFTDHRIKFKQQSSLILQGRLGRSNMPDEGEWAVTGGTGEFAYAQGVASYKRTWATFSNDGKIELHVRVVCLTFPKPIPVQKVGPWGEDYGGTTYEIPEAELPRSLESITIYDDDDVITSIQFTYIDQAGQKRTFGPWGSSDTTCTNEPILLGPLETVKEIYGATGSYEGCTHVTSLTIVTNATIYEPYGKQFEGNTPFHVAAPKDCSIVGFYGRATAQAILQIGAYVTPTSC